MSYEIQVFDTHYPPHVGFVTAYTCHERFSIARKMAVMFVKGLAWGINDTQAPHGYWIDYTDGDRLAWEVELPTWTIKAGNIPVASATEEELEEDSKNGHILYVVRLVRTKITPRRGVDFSQ